MPRPSKFNAERRQVILEALKVGSSRETAAAMARIDKATLTRWIQRGREAAEGSRFREFAEAVDEAEASPRHRALGIIYKEMEDNPTLAWRFIERREPGYAPPMPVMASQPAGPVIVQLAFSGRAPLQLAAAEVIEGEVIDEPDLEPVTDPPAAG